MPSAEAIITNALSELGQITVGSTPNMDKLNFGRGSLNRMLDQFSLLRQFIYTIRADAYNLSPSQTSYTIGPTGDFVAQRPLGPAPGNGIEDANIILTATPGPNLVRTHLYIMNDDQWANLNVQQIPTSIPVAIYNDGAFPNSRLYLWGYPNAGNQLELFTRQRLDTFENLIVNVDFPPGYEDAVTLTLAERMSGPLRSSMPANLMQRAREARANVMSLNSDSPLLQSDAPIHSGPQRPYFNYLTGNLA